MSMEPDSSATQANTAAGSAPPDETFASAPEPLSAPLHFDAVITPHRSLGKAGFLIVMALIGGVSFVAGIQFVTMGAWPVFGYFGLDVLLVFWAFRANYRAARAHETVQISDTELRIRQVDQRGRVRAHSFEPQWVRLDLRENADDTTELHLTSKGRSLEIGRVLSPAERADFADALERVLSDVKAGRLFTAPALQTE